MADSWTLSFADAYADLDRRKFIVLRLPQTIMGSRKCMLFVVVNKRQIERNAQILLTSPELEIEYRLVSQGRPLWVKQYDRGVYTFKLCTYGPASSIWPDNVFLAQKCCVSIHTVRLKQIAILKQSIYSYVWSHTERMLRE